MDARRFDGLARSLAQPASRRSLGAIVGVLGALLLALLPEGATDAKGRRSKRRGRRDGKVEARRDRSRGRAQRGGLQAEKK